MLGAKAAGYHGRPIFLANGEQRGMNVSIVRRALRSINNRE
jgi:hypothetical protein